MLNLDCELQVWYLTVHVNYSQFRSRGVCTCVCLAAGSVCVCAFLKAVRGCTVPHGTGTSLYFTLHKLTGRHGLCPRAF